MQVIMQNNTSNNNLTRVSNDPCIYSEEEHKAIDIDGQNPERNNESITANSEQINVSVNEESQQNITSSLFKQGKDGFLKNPNIQEEAIPEVFFKPIIEYYKTLTDAPKEFLFCSSLMTVAGLIGNRVKCRLGPQEVKPNLYLVMLAGSTINRKSTGVSLTAKKLTEMKKRLKKSLLMPESGSLEGLIEAMREAKGQESKEVMNSGIACYSEFAGFLDNIRKDYNSGYESFVLDVYDGNNHTRQLKKEHSEIKDPCLSIFGAITMAQFNLRITETDKQSGLLQRFLFSYHAERKDKLKSLVDIRSVDPEEENKYLQILEKIYNTAEAIKTSDKFFTLTPQAKALYQKSFDEQCAFLEEMKASNLELASMLYGYHGRIDMMKFKIAMIYETVKRATSDYNPSNDDPVITGESMNEAILAINYFWRSLAHLLAVEFRFTPYAQQLKKLEGILKRNGGSMLKNKLLKNSSWKASDFNAVLDTAIESGILSIIEKKGVSGQTSKTVKLN